MYDPERSFAFLIHDSARLMRREFERQARAIGLTRAQWAAIAHLRRNEGCNQSTLADLLDVEPITLARLLDRMEAAGWVRRQADPKDRRARLIYLTDKAKPLLDRLGDLAQSTRDVALSGLTPEEQERAIDFMLKVRSNLSDRDRAAAAGGSHRLAATGERDAEPAEWPVVGLAARRHG